jgi:hypothetical protein
MKLYCLGAVTSRNVLVSAATNATPIVLTLAGSGFAGNNALNPAVDILTIASALVNTNANGSYAPGSYQINSPTSITLVSKAGNGVYTASSATASSPQQLIYCPNFPAIPGVADLTKLMVRRMLFTTPPQVTGTLTAFVGTAGLNQSNFTNVFRPINPPPPTGIFDFYNIEEGDNIIPLADYWVDSLRPGVDNVIASFWIG